MLVHYRMHAESVSSKHNRLQQANFARNLQAFWLKNQVAIENSTANLITHTHSNKVCLKDYMNCQANINYLIDVYLKQDYTLKEFALRTIANRHVQRMNLQLLKGKASLFLKCLLLFKIGFALRKHYVSRKRF